MTVEADTGRIAIEHRPIWRLYMEAMIFKVREATMLTGLTPSDSIRFEVKRDDKSHVITRIEHSN